jgi:hypothetical protein
MEEIHPGDLVWFAPGEKHWHGQSESKTCARWVPVPICSVIRLTVQVKLSGEKPKARKEKNPAPCWAIRSPLRTMGAQWCARYDSDRCVQLAGPRPEPNVSAFPA